MLNRLILIAILLLPGYVQAQRALPQQGFVGTLTDYRYPEVRVDDKILRLSPAARIINYNNLLILPDNMPRPVRVLYQIDVAGNIKGIWLLTEAEYEALRGSPPKPVQLPAPPPAKDDDDDGKSDGAGRKK